MKKIFKKIGIIIVLLMILVGLLSIVSFSYNTDFRVALSANI